jgi:uncharacterized protein YbjT (DUF2867 family)
MTRIALFGATGGTGREFLRQALADGHEVTALIRGDAGRLGVEHPSLTVLVGDARNADDVDATINGQEVVFATLGLSAHGSHDEVVTVCTDALEHIIVSMDRHGIRRLVSMSTHGVNETDGTQYAKDLWDYVGERLRDKVTMEQVIRASDLDWTIVRAPLIKQDEPRGDAIVGSDVEIDHDSFITEANIGRFVLGELTDPHFVNVALSIKE